MRLRADVFTALVLSTGIGLAMSAETPAARLTGVPDGPGADDVSFSEQIAPILTKRCIECHGEEKAELSLRLDSYEGVMTGSEYGAVVEPGDPDASILVEMIAYGDMPEEGDPVPPEELELIVTWIAEGAKNN